MQNNSHVISIAQQKGGAGKTTIAAHLAICLMQSGNKVALVDTDPQGSLTDWYNLRADKFGSDFTGITFSSIAGWKIQNDLEMLKRNHDFIIIDTPPRVEADSKSVIRASDLVIVPVQPSPVDLWATNSCINFIRDEKIDFRVLLNRVNNNSKILDKFSKQIQKPMTTVLGNRVAFASTMLNGTAITETQPKSPAAEEVKLFTKEISQILKKAKKAA